MATDVDGAPELLHEGVNAYLALPRDVGGLADRVCRLLEKPALRRAMGQRAKRSVPEDWSYQALVSGSEAVYRGAAR